MASIIKRRPIDIEVWLGEPEYGEFAGLHWDEVREHPTEQGTWVPYRAHKFIYGPFDCLATIVKSVEDLKPEGYVRYIIVGGDQIRFGPEDIPHGEKIH